MARSRLQPESIRRRLGCGMDGPSHEPLERGATGQRAGSFRHSGNPKLPVAA